MPATTDAFDQSTYQVRLEWGVDGLARLAPADVVVVVDVLRFSTTVIRALEDGGTYALDETAHAVSINGAVIAESAAARATESAAAPGADESAAATAASAPASVQSLVLLGGLRNASAVAAAVQAEQERRGARTSVAVIAAGERTSRDAESPLRFAVEDLLGVGAIIAALSDRGIDHSSPEAAVASESFRALRGATRHLLTASGSGRELADHREEVLAAASIDASTVVPVLREGVFVAL